MVGVDQYEYRKFPCLLKQKPSNVKYKDGEYTSKLWIEVMKEIDPEKVVQMVTDNEAAIKLGEKN